MSAEATHIQGVGPTESDLISIGKLQFLAGFCPTHRHWPAFALARVFYPAINHDCVRFFENEHKKTSAALIWARLSDHVSERMLFDRVPPSEAEWVSGDALWFLDILAPFGHGGLVARHIARNPPKEPFYFARLDGNGQVKRVIRGDVSLPNGQRLTSWALHPDQVGAR